MSTRYTTPDTAHITLRVVVFERAADGSPGYRTFVGRKVSVSPDTILYAREGSGMEIVEKDDVLDETKLAEVES